MCLILLIYASSARKFAPFLSKTGIVRSLSINNNKYQGLKETLDYRGVSRRIILNDTMLATIRITDSIFAEMTTEKGESGGAINIFGKLFSSSITNCLFSRCVSSRFGGAICLFVNTNYLSSCCFSYCICAGHGNSFYSYSFENYQNSHSYLTITKCSPLSSPSGFSTCYTYKGIQSAKYCNTSNDFVFHSKKYVFGGPVYAGYSSLMCSYNNYAKITGMYVAMLLNGTNAILQQCNCAVNDVDSMFFFINSSYITIQSVYFDKNLGQMFRIQNTKKITFSQNYIDQEYIDLQAYPKSEFILISKMATLDLELFNSYECMTHSDEALIEITFDALLLLLAIVIGSISLVLAMFYCTFQEAPYPGAFSFEGNNREARLNQIINDNVQSSDEESQNSIQRQTPEDL